MDDDIECGNNMELLLYAFEQLSGCKISFHKRELFGLDKERRVRNNTRNSLVVKWVHAPFVIWGFP